ncbi:Lrp/AsnC ligand binding domain-containing protein [Candidatus Woesearchaeota archaeon]|jgi:DNA-binding Lrp family transcriptional regulator|nr:Lrp/AsnC ligand binding domain-containing protein [Candidatus Woesearchaeota archaeon]
MLAYLLIRVLENENGVMEELKSMEEVREVHVLFGEWDLLVKLEMQDPEMVGVFVMEKIRSIKEVKLTSTMIVAK